MVNPILNNPELSFSLNLPSNSPFKPSLGAKLPVSWTLMMAIFAILLLLYWTGNLENKDTK